MNECFIFRIHFRLYNDNDKWFIAYSSSMLDCTWNIKTLKQEHTIQNHSTPVTHNIETCSLIRQGELRLLKWTKIWQCYSKIGLPRATFFMAHSINTTSRTAALDCVYERSVELCSVVAMSASQPRCCRVYTILCSVEIYARSWRPCYSLKNLHGTLI